MSRTLGIISQGINAVTLRILRAAPEDEGELTKLVPVVQFSIDRAPAPSGPGGLWQTATKGELATAGRAWVLAYATLERLLALDAQDWMRETTADNLARQARARAVEPEGRSFGTPTEGQCVPFECTRESRRAPSSSLRVTKHLGARTGAGEVLGESGRLCTMHPRCFGWPKSS